MLPIVILFFIFNSSFSQTGKSCSEAIDIKDTLTSLKFPQSKSNTWLKVKVDSTNKYFFDIKSKENELNYFIFKHTSDSSCVLIKKRITKPYAGSIKDNVKYFDDYETVTEAMWHNAIKDGKCCCQSCRRFKQSINLIKDTHYYILVYGDNSEIEIKYTEEKKYKEKIVAIKKSVVAPKKDPEPVKKKATQKIITKNNLTETIDNSNIGDVLTLGKIHFYGGSPRMLPVSINSLNPLVEYLKNNPSINIQIRGHVNISPDYHLSLSRATTVKGYLVKAGIDDKKLEIKGFSNTMMLYPKPKTEYQEQQNRRVDIKIISK